MDVGCYAVPLAFNIKLLHILHQFKNGAIVAATLAKAALVSRAGPGIIGSLAVILRDAWRVTRLDELHASDQHPGPQLRTLVLQRGHGNARLDGKYFLLQNITRIKLLVHPMQGDAGLLVAVGNSPEVGEETSIARQQRRMDIQATQMGQIY